MGSSPKDTQCSLPQKKKKERWMMNGWKRDDGGEIEASCKEKEKRESRFKDALCCQTGNSQLQVFKSDLDKCQSRSPIRGWSSALNCDAILVFFYSPPPLLPLQALLILGPAFPVSASDQMVWNKSIYKGIRAKRPRLVLLAAKHCKQITREGGSAV